MSNPKTKSVSLSSSTSPSMRRRSASLERKRSSLSPLVCPSSPEIELSKWLNENAGQSASVPPAGGSHSLFEKDSSSSPVETNSQDLSPLALAGEVEPSHVEFPSQQTSQAQLEPVLKIGDYVLKRHSKLQGLKDEVDKIQQIISQLIQATYHKNSIFATQWRRYLRNEKRPLGNLKPYINSNLENSGGRILIRPIPLSGKEEDSEIIIAGIKAMNEYLRLKEHQELIEKYELEVYQEEQTRLREQNALRERIKEKMIKGY